MQLFGGLPVNELEGALVELEDGDGGLVGRLGPAEDDVGKHVVQLRIDVLSGLLVVAFQHL